MKKLLALTLSVPWLTHSRALSFRFITQGGSVFGVRITDFLSSIQYA